MIVVVVERACVSTGQQQEDSPAGGSVVIQAYRFALDPSPRQQAMLASLCGAARFAFNWGLARVKAVLEQRSAERSYGLAEEDLTPAVSWSAYSLRKTWNAVKPEVAPWWGENSKEAYASGLAHLATALENWNASRTGQRTGRRVGFPRFKTKRNRWSCRFTTGSFGLASADRRHVRLPRIGEVRTHESTRKLARHLERGSGRIRSATVSWQRGRWQVAFSVEITRREPVAPSRGGVVGVDLGVKHLAVLSTGETVANPQHFERAQRQLRRWQRKAARRQGPDKRTRQKASGRWHRAQSHIVKLHTAVANARQDGLHQLSARLVEQFGTVVVEDLHVAGMLRNPRLARAIADVGMGELRRQLTYKTTWHHRALVVADRWYPSSKTCSDCGVVKAKLRLSERMFHCQACGLRLDRDLNAARNLATLVETVAGGASSQSRGATKNEPAGNPPKTTTPAGVPGVWVPPREDPGHHGRGQRRVAIRRLRKPCTY